MGQGEENGLGQGPHAPGPDEKVGPLTLGRVRGPAGGMGSAAARADDRSGRDEAPANDATAAVAATDYSPNTEVKEKVMNWDQVAGNWKQFKGTVREKWGKLTDDDLDVVAGKRDQLLGKIQERYGITKEEAEKEFKKHWK